MEWGACKIQDTTDRVAEAVNSSGTAKVDMRSALVYLSPTAVSEDAIMSAGFCARLSLYTAHVLFPKIALVHVLSDLIPYYRLCHVVRCGGESLVGISHSLRSCSPAGRPSGSWCAASPLARGCLQWHITHFGQHFCNFAFELLQDSWVNTIWSQWFTEI